KEQLGPAPSSHHLAPPPAEFGDADQPGRTRPAPLQERLRRGIMDDAAVAREQAAMRRSDDLAGRGDAVLQANGWSTPSLRAKAEPSIWPLAETWIASSLRSSQ